jgi:hypothetical protein
MPGSMESWEAPTFAWLMRLDGLKILRIGLKAQPLSQWLYSAMKQAVKSGATICEADC